MIEVLPHGGRHPLFSTSGCRALETEALAAAPAHALMARAGLAVARLALAIAPHARRVWVACGPGNNGGDGLVAARHLARQGLDVHVSLLNTGRPLPADAQWALEALTPLTAAPDARVHLRHSPHPPAGCDLFIDALLGLGVRRAPQGALAEAIAALGAGDAPVLSVDLPSGLQGDTGQPCPDADGRPGAVVRADHTLCLLSLKPGLFTAQGRDLAGRVWLDTLGHHAPAGDAGWLIAPGDPGSSSASDARVHASHKGSYGQVLVVGGAAHMQGAAELAACAALAAGAGKVFVKSLSLGHHEAPRTAAHRRPELMDWPEGSAGRLDGSAAWQDLTLVTGCGAGTALETAGLLLPLLQHAHRLVLDADGLNSVATHEPARQALASRRAQGLQTVLTPHPLEAARLLGLTVAQVQNDRLGAARALSATFGCTVVLKGSGTLIASPGEPLHLNGSGNAALASAGTGDVLAGWMGGLWAQQSGDAPHEIATRSVARHGEAAQGARAPLRAADLIEQMHALQPPLP